MTQENKEFLLKDLCGRLPYGVKCEYYDCYEGDYNEGTAIGFERKEFIHINGGCIHIEEVKPYLFPLSSMTEEKWKEYQTLKMTDWVKGDINGAFINAGTITDWLNAHHFDYRGLIEKGLAVDATGLNIY